MKNNILIYFFITFIFLIFFESKVNSEELQINASEIQSLEKGNKVIAYNGVEIIDPKGIVIQAQTGNTGHVMVGDLGVTAESEGIAIYAGDTMTLNVKSTLTIVVRASNATDKINVMVMQ